MRKPLLPLGLLVLLFAACDRQPESGPAPDSRANTPQEQDRHELTRQPAPDWKPGGEERKLAMLLLIDKTRIRKGDGFGYRVEMQNAGREPLEIKEGAPSFTKDGSLCGRTPFKILVTPPGGRETALPCAPKGAVAVSTGPAAPPESGIELILQPGEYLLTRASGPKNKFRPLLTEMKFDAVGTYRLKAVYDPKGPFSAASNTVDLEVVP